jgi:tRNA (Thr-GGU) A37 N-methylase
MSSVSPPPVGVTVMFTLSGVGTPSTKLHSTVAGVDPSISPGRNPMNPEQGVFSTRSQDRPNPIGLHRVEIVAIDANRIRVRDLEAINGTPILDVKPVLDLRDR